MSFVDDELLDRTTALLRARPRRLHVIATGAGAGIQEALWSVPGCSSYLAGASFPYAPSETAAILGYSPEHFVDDETAIGLAMSAYMNAVDLNRTEVEPVGLGVTAAVATSRQRRGENRVHVSCVTRQCIISGTMGLGPGVGLEARGEQGCTVDHFALACLQAALKPDEPYDWTDVSGEARAALFRRPFFAGDGQRLPESGVPQGATLFPGAFNPPHLGHTQIAEAARRWSPDTGAPVFAICATPPHKPALTVQDLLERAARLRSRRVLFTEGDPLYIDKAQRFPGRSFVVGADALIRMVDPRWCSDSRALLREFEEVGTRFGVFGREVDGAFVTAIRAIEIAGAYEIATPLDGRWDVSSSALRALPP